jgi:cellulose synthase/poly-beta-1,6-N-acetylglucosamine synthase-like glycosyltransferase
VNLWAALLLAIDALVLFGLVVWPLPRAYNDSDRGSGSLVALPSPRRPSLARCGFFVLICLATCVFIVGLRTPNVEGTYQHLVQSLINSVLRQPSLVTSFSGTLIPVVPISVIAFGIAFAVGFPSSLGRRAAILLNVVLFLAVSIVTDAILGVVVVGVGLPLGPTPVLSILIHYTIAFVLIFRLAFTSFQLPHKTPVPLLRRGDLGADVLLVASLVAAFVFVATVMGFLIHALGNDPLVDVLFVLAFPPCAFACAFGFLGLFRLSGQQRPEPNEERPPIEIIIPAYNEEVNIVSLLASLDAAALRYAGRVRVILCDDGSIDATRPLAEEAMAHFGAATGEVIAGSHGGKSEALNQALAVCTADYVFRVDADCVVDEWCFVYAIPWFLRDPQVGLVGAFTLPKEPYSTWIDRMRMFELLFSFGFTRVCAAEIDAVPCIPGTFVGFRRELAIRIGGFVEGMWGEDVDFTCSIARLGYRAAIDRRVISFEDVPNTIRQLRIQRTRWNRGGTMTFARFTPFGCGFAGPRFWFTSTRAAGKRLSSPLHLATLCFALSLAVFRPTPSHNLARIGFVLLAAQAANLMFKVLIAIYYKRARYIPWLGYWYLFSLVKRLFALEAFLSFIARPVAWPRVVLGRQPRVALPTRPASDRLEVA